MNYVIPSLIIGLLGSLLIYLAGINDTFSWYGYIGVIMFIQLFAYLLLSPFIK